MSFSFTSLQICISRKKGRGVWALQAPVATPNLRLRFDSPDVHKLIVYVASLPHILNKRKEPFYFLDRGITDLVK
jgi:hypothetical protein